MLILSSVTLKDFVGDMEFSNIPQAKDCFSFVWKATYLNSALENKAFVDLTVFINVSNFVLAARFPRHRGWLKLLF